MALPPTPSRSPAMDAGKAALRRHFRAIRRAALGTAGPLLQQTALRELPGLLPAGGVLGLYWPLAGEADLRPLAALGCPLALPAVRPGPAAAASQIPSAGLAYRPWCPGDPLQPDACGIPAPCTPDLPPEALGLLLVPALALDPATAIRLGYGGGWYDRLRADPAWRAVPALALLPSACLAPGLPRDPWDVPLDGWLDERGVHRLASADGGGSEVAM